MPLTPALIDHTNEGDVKGEGTGNWVRGKLTQNSFPSQQMEVLREENSSLKKMMKVRDIDEASVRVGAHA